MSEARRYAKALSGVRERSFESRFSAEDSAARLKAALAGEKLELEGDRVVIRAHRARYEGRWVAGDQGARLEGRFVPLPSTRMQLTGLSILLTIMVLASVRALMVEVEGAAVRYLLPAVTTISVLFFMPLFIMALGAAREGDEARIERAMRVALEDLDAKMPPPQKWKDEE